MNVAAKESRRSRRRATYLNASIVIGGGKHNVWVRDISVGGAQIFVEQPLSIGQRVIFTVDNSQKGALVRWIDYPLAGIQFEGGPAIAVPTKGELTVLEKRAAMRALAKQNSGSLLSSVAKKLSGRR